MNKTKPKSVKRPSQRIIIFSWICSVASLVVLYAAGNAVLSDMAGFRSCGRNTSNLAVTTCGRQSPNVGDLIIFGLFFLAACLTMSLFTGAIRMTRRPS